MYELLKKTRQTHNYQYKLKNNQQQHQLHQQQQHEQQHLIKTQFINFVLKEDNSSRSNSTCIINMNFHNTNIMSTNISNSSSSNNTITNTTTTSNTNPLWSTFNDMSTNTIVNSNDSSSTSNIITNIVNLDNISNSSLNLFKNSSNSNNTLLNQDPDETNTDEYDVLHTIEYIGNVLCFYYVPIIVVTGSIGNILSVCVFFKTKLRKLSSSFYLAALAVSDTCFLFGLFAQWLNFVDIHIYNREYFCQFFTFFSNLACFCSVWFVVAFTVERFIAVMYPLRRQTMCTVRRAKMVLVGLTVLGCLHCAPFWISSTPVYKPKLEATICDLKSEYKDYITLLNYWDTVVVFAVPFTTIAILNTFTGCTVWKFATVRRTLTMQKMKTQHLPLHRTASSPSSTCSVNLNTKLDGSTAASIKTTTTITTTAAVATGHQGISSSSSAYRITNASLKRQKSTSCTTTTHSNGQHKNNIVTLQQQQQNQQQQQQHTHSHRATMIKLATSGSCDCNDILSRKSRRRKVTNSSQLKVTKMLLIVSTVFVCLNLPSCIMRMITYLETQSSANAKTTIVLQYIFHLLFITNFGINFVLYCVSGQNFRKAVLSMFRRVSTTQRDGNTQITVSEYYRNSGGIGGGGVGAGVGGCGTNTSTRRRMMNTQNCWNEIHELQRLK